MENMKTLGKLLQIFLIVILVTSGFAHFFLVMSVAVTDLAFSTSNVLFLNPYMSVYSGLVVGLVTTLVVRSFVKRNDPTDEVDTPISDFFKV